MTHRRSVEANAAEVRGKIKERIMKRWHFGLIAITFVIAGCADVMTPVAGRVVSAQSESGHDDPIPFSAFLQINQVPDNPECFSFPVFDECVVQATMTGDLVSESYTSLANGAIGGVIMGVHTVVGCIDDDCGTLSGIAITVASEPGGPPMFSYDLRGVDGDLEDVRILGHMIEVFNGSEEFFEFDVVGTLDPDFDPDDDGDDDDDDE